MVSELFAWVSTLELREPWYLLACFTAPAILLMGLMPSGRLVFSSLKLLPAESRTWRTRLIFTPTLLLAMAAAFLGVALAGPRIPDSTQRIEAEGIAIMMAVDISGSMRALDLDPQERDKSRLDVVKEVFRDFVQGSGDLEGRRDDAIGIVSFAGFADTRCPLTLDHNVISEVLSDVNIVDERREDGTALGDGLGLAVHRLRESTAKSRVVILLTDGVQTRGELTPMEAAELAAKSEVKVYTIGAGTDGLAPVPYQDPFTGQTRLSRERVEIDEATLRAVADATGGRYFRATDGQALREVYKNINALERTKIGEQQFRNYSEYFQWFLGIGLALAALAWLLQVTAFRRLP